jgi:hypothetical protein
MKNIKKMNSLTSPLEREKRGVSIKNLFIFLFSTIIGIDLSNVLISQQLKALI